MKSLKVLITNIGIAERTGTEIVTMDLARGLLRAGHQPLIWTPILRRELVSDLVDAGIPVVDRLEDLPCAPDVIHGHHHLETVAALRHFPDTHAIFVRHSGYWWFDHPPRHPRIARYVAVDDFCRERLDACRWIESSSISVIPNAVDLARFRARPPLPARPRRAAVFSNYVREGPVARAIDEACRRTGLEATWIGSGMGNLSTAPEKLLPEFDLVFGKARCAIEALAVGCSVVVLDERGLAGLVTSATFDAWRRWNFGFRLLTRALDAGAIEAEIRRYDAADARVVSQRARTEADLGCAVRRYVELYREAIATPPRTDLPDDYPPTERIEIGDQEKLRLAIVDAPAAVPPSGHFEVRVSLDNQSTLAVATAPPWVTLFLTRWLDATSGTMVVEHGFRTQLQPPSQPRSAGRYAVHVIAPAEPGRYMLRVTMIQEGWRWLDHLAPAVASECVIEVSAT